jgi:RNA polymerase primary sigma factor
MLRSYRSDMTTDSLEEEEAVVVRTVTLQVPKRIDPGSTHDSITHDAVVLIGLAEDGAADASKVSYMRGSLMTIQESKVLGLPLGAQPFRAIVLGGGAAGQDPGDRAAERFLRAAENPEHDRWEGTTDLTTRYAAGAKTRLRQFFEGVRAAIKDVVTAPSVETSDGPEGLRELLRITPPKPETDPRPRVREATGKPNADGAWEVEAVVSLPARSEPWVFEPILRYGTESGPPIPVRWAQVTPVSHCSSDHHSRLSSDKGARSVKFRAVTDPVTHPVAAKRAKVLIDVRVYGGAEG